MWRVRRQLIGVGTRPAHRAHRREQLVKAYDRRRCGAARLNLWRLADGPCQWQKCVRPNWTRACAHRQGIHRHGSAGYVDLVVSSLAEPHTWRSDCVPFLGLEAATLEHWTARPVPTRSQCTAAITTNLSA